MSVALQNWGIFRVYTPWDDQLTFHFPFFTILALLACLLSFIQQHYRWKVCNFNARTRFSSLGVRDDAMSRAVAGSIVKNMLEYEMPFMSRLSMELAQFRTFGIPTIGKVLHSSKGYESDCPRRYDDTDLILREVSLSMHLLVASRLHFKRPVSLLSFNHSFISFLLHRHYAR
jgi:hypothetical protein